MNNDVKLPLALHESAIERHVARGADGNVVPDAGIQTAHRAMAESRALAEQAAASFSAIMRDPGATNEIKLVRSRKACSELVAAAIRKIEAGRAKIADEIKQSRNGTWSPLVDTSAHGAEIRSVLRRMTAEERIAAVARAMDAGDHIVIASVLEMESAPFTCGMTRESIQGYRRLWRERFHPAEADRERRLAAADADLERAGKATVSWLENLFAQHPVAELTQRAHAAAQAAVAAAKAAETQES